MLASLAENGRIGLVAVGDLAAEADALYRRTQSVLDEEARLALAPRELPAYLRFAHELIEMPAGGLLEVCFRSLRGRHLRHAACRRSAMCGRRPVGKGFLHVCSWVGAAMCAASLRGSHDRWP